MLTEEYDFTESNPTTGKINGYILQDNNVSFDSNGATFSETDSYLKFPEVLSVLDSDEWDWAEYEISVKSVPSVSRARLLTHSNDFGAINDNFIGFIWWNSKWDVWTLGTHPFSTGNNSDFFNDSKLTYKIKKIDTSRLEITIKKNNTEMFNQILLDIDDFTGCTTVSLGSHRNAMNMILEGLKVTIGKN